MGLKFTYARAVDKIRDASKRGSLMYGVPFILLLVLGSFGLRQFTSLRYEFRKNEMLKDENLQKYGIRKKRVTIEEEYEKIKKLDLDAWENIRGPRPWEEQPSK